jgi:hypothetical protein
MVAPLTILVALTKPLVRILTSRIMTRALPTKTQELAETPILLLTFPTTTQGRLMMVAGYLAV